MGKDKALLKLEGQPMALRVVEAMRRAGAADVQAIGGDVPALRALGLTCVPDAWPGEGPLGGVLVALRWASQEAGVDAVLIASCDLKAPSPEAMRTTVATLRAAPDAALAAPTLDRVPQWLHAAWRPSASEPLWETFAAGERAIHRAVEASGLVLTVAEGIDPASLADADTPSQISDP